MADRKNINMIKTLDYYGEKVTKQMKGILKTKGKRATGRLINSIVYDVVQDKKGEYELEIDYVFYGKFVDGNPEPRWKKGKGPPPSEIRKWLMAKNIPYRHSGRGKRPNRKKQLDIMTYLIVRKIKRRKKLNPLYNNPTNFTKPIDDTLGSKKWKKDIHRAAVKDAANTIREYLKNKK